MFTIRDIISDAYNRTGIWPNSTDSLPGEYAVQGELLLQGIISSLNINNYLAFTRKSVTFNVTKAEMIIGENYIVDDNIIIATDIYMPNFEKINSVYLNENNQGYDVSFVSFEEFNGYPNSQEFYSWLAVDDIQGKILFKDEMIGNSVTVFYNEGFEVNLDSEMRVPNVYRQLWTLALMVEIMKDYPKMDNTQLTGYMTSYQSLLSSLTAVNAANKVKTNMMKSLSRHQLFESGGFLFGR